MIPRIHQVPRGYTVDIDPRGIKRVRAGSGTSDDDIEITALKHTFNAIFGHQHTYIGTAIGLDRGALPHQTF